MTSSCGAVMRVDTMMAITAAAAVAAIITTPPQPPPQPRCTASRTYKPSVVVHLLKMLQNNTAGSAATHHAPNALHKVSAELERAGLRP